ncbi:MAG: flagellar assembly peptidoglycan hydrolase FlgJ [Candidatus Competibacteraceae bacterium]|nr:MAG: flagellar assembly peptidoglycan hydrolase FlgJ [Candidatus Competibacteraceae bacterium]
MNTATATESAFVYTDVQGLANLRHQARQQSPEAIREAAQQFEAVFIQMMLKSMRAAGASEGGLLDNDQSRLYHELFDQQIALSMARQGQLGIADLVARQLGVEEASPPPRPASPPISGDPLAALRQVERIRASVAMPAVAAEAASPPSPAAPDRPRTRYPVEDAPFEPSSPAAFVRRMWPHAQNAARELGVAPEVLIAQAAHETGWGRSLPRFADGRTSHNLFGIKAHRGWQGERVVNSTLEFEGGVAVRQRDGFRAYRSYAESFEDYVNFLRVNPRYTDALKQVQDGPAYLRALQRAGYATDPSYARKIESILNGPTLESALGPLKSAAAGPIGEAMKVEG